MPRAAEVGGAGDLEPDVTEIEDIKDRENEQLKYYGGDPIEDDDDDLSALDRGDNLEEESASEDRGDQVEEDESEEEPAGDEKGESGDEEDHDESGDEGEDADSEAEDSDDGDSGDTEESESDQVDDDDNEVVKEEPKPDNRVPLSRFNEVNERMKNAERRLEQLEAEKAASEEAAEDQFDFDQAEKDYMDLLLDGKTDEAAAKRREIRSAEQELFTKEASSQSVANVNEQAELRDLNSLSLQAEEAYPVFDEKSADYDPVIANKVVTYMKGYMADGQTVSDAFVSGLADVIEQYGLDGRYGATESEETQTEDKGDEVIETKGKPIKKTKEKIAAAKKAAPSPGKHGEGSADRGLVAPSIEDMSDEDLDKLTPEQLARMRGDYVE